MTFKELNNSLLLVYILAVGKLPRKIRYLTQIKSFRNISKDQTNKILRREHHFRIKLLTNSKLKLNKLQQNLEQFR